jgi:hypothetical protein
MNAFQEGRLAAIKERIIHFRELVENSAFCESPLTIFSDPSGCEHFVPADIEELQRRKLVSIEGEKPVRIARLCS